MTHILHNSQGKINSFSVTYVLKPKYENRYFLEKNERQLKKFENKFVVIKMQPMMCYYICLFFQPIKLCMLFQWFFAHGDIKRSILFSCIFFVFIFWKIPPCQSDIHLGFYFVCHRNAFRASFQVCAHAFRIIFYRLYNYA